MGSKLVSAAAGNSKLIQLRVDGTGTASLSGLDKNLATLTDNGTGDYTLTFSPVMPQPPLAIAVPLTADADVRLHSAPTSSVVRFLSTASSEQAASLTLNGIKFHSSLKGADGNDITIEITAGATAGSEVVTVTDAGAISIQVETTVSTATQVYAALTAGTGESAEALNYVTPEVITGATTWATAAAAPLTGGIDAGEALDADFDVLILGADLN